jgi:Rrf2 family transcriptional regulator, nitric oxide-sensitive transcriptional repressor
MFCLRFLLRRTFSTDYALRLLMLVGLEIDRLVTIEEVADRFGISKNHLMKVAYQLAQAGYLETVRGRNGGLRLGKTPSQIVVGAVVRKIEPDFAVVECENPGTTAGSNAVASSEKRRIRFELVETFAAGPRCS